MSIQWLFFIGGLLGGIVLALVLRGVFIDYKHRAEQIHFVLRDKTGEIIPEWVKVPKASRPVTKIDGAKAIPTFSKEFRYSYQNRPAYFVSSETGEPFNIHPAPMKEPWPNAYDRLRLHESVREHKIANAPKQNDGMTLAKLGAIGGIVAGAMTVIILMFLVRTFGGGF